MLVQFKLDGRDLPSLPQEMTASACQVPAPENEADVNAKSKVKTKAKLAKEKSEARKAERARNRDPRIAKRVADILQTDEFIHGPKDAEVTYNIYFLTKNDRSSRVNEFLSVTRL